MRTKAYGKSVKVEGSGGCPIPTPSSNVYLFNQAYTVIK